MLILMFLTKQKTTNIKSLKVSQPMRLADTHEYTFVPLSATEPYVYIYTRIYLCIVVRSTVSKDGWCCVKCTYGMQCRRKGLNNTHVPSPKTCHKHLWRGLWNRGVLQLRETMALPYQPASWKFRTILPMVQSSDVQQALKGMFIAPLQSVLLQNTSNMHLNALPFDGKVIVTWDIFHMTEYTIMNGIFGTHTCLQNLPANKFPHHYWTRSLGVS